MIVSSKRVADAINRVRIEQAAWMLRMVIDEALTLLENKSLTADEMRSMLEYGRSVSENMIDEIATCRIGGA